MRTDVQLPAGKWPAVGGSALPGGSGLRAVRAAGWAEGRPRGRPSSSAGNLAQVLSARLLRDQGACAVQPAASLPASPGPGLEPQTLQFWGPPRASPLYPQISPSPTEAPGAIGSGLPAPRTLPSPAVRVCSQAAGYVRPRPWGSQPRPWGLRTTVTPWVTHNHDPVGYCHVGTGLPRGPVGTWYSRSRCEVLHPLCIRGNRGSHS